MPNYSLGSFGKHREALGGPGIKSWAEIRKWFRIRLGRNAKLFLGMLREAPMKFRFRFRFR